MNNNNNRPPQQHLQKNKQSRRSNRLPQKRQSQQQQPQPQQQQSNPMSGVPYGHLPAFLPGSASLVEQLDRRVMIVLRDGRHLVGFLRSFDQFSNMVLENTSERRIQHVKTSIDVLGGDKDKASSISTSSSPTDTEGNRVICYYTDIQLGLYLVRGDSMVLLGEVHEESKEEGEDGEAHQGDDDGEKDVVAGSNAEEEKLTGSGLLMGGGGDHTVVSMEARNVRQARMKKVSLEVFEKIQKKVKEEKEKNGDDAVVDELTWEFDLDLVV